MSILSFIPGQLVSIALVTAFTITLWLIKLLVLRKLNFFDVVS